MDDAAFRRYAEINLPHARSVAERICRTLEALAALLSLRRGERADSLLR